MKESIVRLHEDTMSETSTPDAHVIKASAAIQISNSVSLLERRTWNILLYNCYDELLEKEEHEIRIDELCKTLSYNSNNQDYIKSLLRNLRRHEVQWNILDKDKGTEWGIAGLIAGAKVVNGVCYYSFYKSLREKLYRPEMYARISLVTQNRFKSKYSLALYELCIDYFDVKRQAGETPWITIEQFRELMGLDDNEYTQYKYLGQKVIKNPVKEINRLSNIWVDFKAESRSAGRKITHLKFFITPNKNNKDIPTPKRRNTGTQQRLPDPMLELDNIGLFREMTEDFGVSIAKATEILKTTDEIIIEKSLDYVRKKIKEGKISSSIGGYTVTVIENGGEQLASKQDASVTQKQYLEDQQRKVEAQKLRENLKFKFDDSIRQRLDNIWSNFPTKMKTDFEERFVKEVLDADPAYTHVKKQYKQDGLESTSVKMMFMSFFKPFVLTQEELDFEKFYTEKCKEMGFSFVDGD